MIGTGRQSTSRFLQGCGGNRVYLRRSTTIILFCRIELGIGNVHQHIAGPWSNGVFAQIRGCLSAGFPVEVRQRVIGRAVHQRTVCNVLLVCFHSHTVCVCFARLCAFLMLISRCALQEHFGHVNGAGACHSLVPGAKQHRTADGNQFSLAGNAAVVQLHSAAAVGIQCNVSTTAVGHQNRIVFQRQRSVFHFQCRLAFTCAAGLVALNEYLTLDGHVALCGNHSLIVGTVFQVAVGQIVGVGIDSGIFQRGAAFHAELAADGRAGGELLVERIVIHRECAAALHINDALHHRIGQRQFAAVLHNNAHAAENFHVRQGQIASSGDIQGLGNVPGLDLFPGDVIAKEAVGAAGMGAEPDFQIFWHTDAVFFALNIAAEVFNGPRLHNIPCIQAIVILFQILDLDLVCQFFLTGVNAEGQLIAVRSAALIVLYMNGDQVAACVLRRTIQRQVTAEGHVDTLHAAVLGSGHTLGGVRYDADGALAAHQTNFGLVVQFFPIFVRGVGAFFHQSAVHGDSTVLVAGSAATGAGNAVVILLADNSGFKAAFDFHMQLINVAGCGVGRNLCVSFFINHQFEHQVIVTLGGDGDNVAAFQNVCSGIAAVILLSKCQNQCFGTGHIV